MDPLANFLEKIQRPLLIILEKNRKDPVPWIFNPGGSEALKVVANLYCGTDSIKYLQNNNNNNKLLIVIKKLLIVIKKLIIVKNKQLLVSPNKSK